MEEFNKFIYINELLVRYGGLLTAKQLEAMKLYYHLNLSLQEISENLNISRAAVSDTLKKAVQHLENYEDKLGLSRQKKARKKLVDQLRNSNLTSQQKEIVERLEEEI